MPSTSSRRRSSMLLIGVVLLMVNFPVVHSWWLDRQLATDGVETTATVVGVDSVASDEDGRRFVSVRFDEEIDPAQEAWPAVVEAAVADGLSEGDEIPVRVVPEGPRAFEVEGQVHSRTGLYTTLAADAVIAAIGWLLWRRGGRRTPEDDADDEPGTSPV